VAEVYDGPVEWHDAIPNQEYIICRFALPLDRRNDNYADYVDLTIVKVPPGTTLEGWRDARLRHMEGLLGVHRSHRIEVATSFLGALPASEIAIQYENPLHSCQELMLFGLEGEALFVLHFRAFLEYGSPLTQRNLRAWYRMAGTFRTTFTVGLDGGNAEAVPD
jgi:hypothetical protein